MTDTCQTVKQAVPENPIYRSNAYMSMWKSFNEYEQESKQKHQKASLRDEINDIALKIVKAREAKQAEVGKKLEFGIDEELTSTVRNWKVPQVEHFNRGFNESSRFYNCFPYQRQHGLKFVPPPKAEHL